jgi:hypothetical protein
MFGGTRQCVGCVVVKWRKWAGRSLAEARITGIDGRRLLKRGALEGCPRDMGQRWTRLRA